MLRISLIFSWRLRLSVVRQHSSRSRPHQPHHNLDLVFFASGATFYGNPLTVPASIAPLWGLRKRSSHRILRAKSCKIWLLAIVTLKLFVWDVSRKYPLPATDPPPRWVGGRDGSDGVITTCPFQLQRRWTCNRACWTGREPVSWRTQRDLAIPRQGNTDDTHHVLRILGTSPTLTQSALLPESLVRFNAPGMESTAIPRGQRVYPASRDRVYCK